MKFTAIITYGRAGSTYLCKLLDEHPKVVFDGEVFNRSRTDSNSFKGYFRNAFPTNILNNLFNRDRILKSKMYGLARPLYQRFLKEKEANAEHYGFKVTADQLAFDPHLPKLIRRHGSVILLTRRDRLRQALSMIKARSSSNYANFDASADSYNEKEVMREVQMILKWEKSAQQEFKNALQICSEDLFSSPEVVLSRIHSFISLKSNEPFPNATVPSVSNLSDIRSWVSNYDELERMYKKREW